MMLDSHGTPNLRSVNQNMLENSFVSNGRTIPHPIRSLGCLFSTIRIT